jgi:hypothetical protein
MRQWIRVLVLAMSLTCVAEAQTDKGLLKIHKLRLEGPDWRASRLADVAADWVKHSALGWIIVDRNEPADAALVLEVTSVQETVVGVDDCLDRLPQRNDRSSTSDPSQNQRESELLPGVVKDCRTGNVEFSPAGPGDRKAPSKTRLRPVLSLHPLPATKDRPLFRKDLGELDSQTLVRGLSEIEKSVLKLRAKQTK